MQLFSEAGDVDPYHADLGFAVIAPDLFHQPFGGDQVAGVLHQQLQDLELPVRQPEAAGGGRELIGALIQGDIAHLQHRAGLAGLGPGYGPDACQQFPGMERLGEIVIGTAVQSQHLVGHL